MARYLKTVLAQDETITAGAVPLEKDLPVNPLSHINLTVRAQTLTVNVLPTLANLLDVFTNVEVLFKGTSIVSCSLADLYRYAGHLWRKWPRIFRLNDDVNASTFLTVPIPFGRRPYWTEEAFPAVRRGDLRLKLTIRATFPNLTGVTLQAETVELLDVDPRRFCKITSQAKTPATTGFHEVDLPIGNKLLAVLLFGTTVPTGTVFTASIGQIKLLLDNVEFQTAISNFESAHGENLWMHGSAWDKTTLRLLENLAGVYTQNVESGAPSDLDGDAANYLYLDYDPHMDGAFAVETAGRARVHLNINADVADAIRVLPVELVELPGGTPGA